MTRATTGIAVLAAAALAASVGLPGATADARRRNHRAAFYKAKAERYEAAYNELLAGLDRVERINDRRRGRRARARIQRTIDRARSRAADLLEVRDEVRYDGHHDGHAGFRGDVDVTVVAPVTDHRGVWYETAEPMTRADFRALRTAVDDASFASEQIRLVETACEHNWFTVAQVVALMSEASFADTKVEIATLMYPRVLVLDDWYQVYNALDFESSRAKLRKRISAQQR